MQTRYIFLATTPALLLVAAAWRSSAPIAVADEVSVGRLLVAVEPFTSPPVLFNPHAAGYHPAGHHPAGPHVQPPSESASSTGSEAIGVPRRLPTPLIPSPATRAMLGRPRVAERPQIPDEAKALLPPGCVDTWDGPYRTVADRGHAEEVIPAASDPLGQPRGNVPGDAPDDDDLLGGSSAGEHLLGENLLGEDLLGESAKEVDPLSSLGPRPDDPAAEKARAEAAADGVAPGGAGTEGGLSMEDPHRALFLEDSYPSAMTCAKCHPTQYEQWRVSAHAYAVVSPMFQRFEQKMTELTRGTVGHFCQRCHAPVATQIELPRYATILDAPPIVREGITCVACHRVAESYGKTHGGRRIEPGDIFAPVAAGGDGAGVANAIADRERLKIKTGPDEIGPGQAIHRGAHFFEPLTRSDFCLSCHQVAVHPGLWLEVVYSQYRNGPAAAKGIGCQECHMGSVPGKPAGFACDHIATLAGKPYGEPRKQSNHTFWGPGYSIAHPGVFPQHEKAERWSPREWLRFDWQSGWGTEEFERAMTGATTDGFPPPWDNADERRDARRILDQNLRSLALARAGSIATMEAGSAIEGPRIARRPLLGEPLQFSYIVRNVSEGHNLPTGSLGAQPQVWLNVALVAPDGHTVWESGYLDSLGDLADNNSLDVAHGRVPRDSQLFNLQTRFLISNLKGTDREVPLPVDVDIDQLPFLRPGAVPVSVLNHPPRIRMEAHSIPPLGARTAHYRVPGDRIDQSGLYRLDVRLRSRVEPSYFMRFVGSTPEMINRMNHQILDIHTQSHTFYVD